MQELIDKCAAYTALKHEEETHGLSFSAEAFGKAARIIDQMPTIKADIDRAAILRLCNEIEMIIVTVCDTGYTLQIGDEEAIMKRTKAIRKELAEDAGSKTD